MRTQLQNWNDLVLDYMEDEITAKNFTLKYYYSYLRKKIAFTNYKSNVGVLNHPKIDLSFLTDLKFENLIHTRMEVIYDIVNPDETNELNEFSGSIDKIIELTTNKKYE